MKKLFCVLLSLLLAAAVCSCGATSGTVTSEDQTVQSDAGSAQPAETGAGDADVLDGQAEGTDAQDGQTEDADAQNGQAEDAEAVSISDMVEVESGWFSVSLTIPADYVEEGVTQEKLDQTVAEKGYKSAALNEDGSVTYVMTKAQHRDLVDSFVEAIEESLNEMVGSEDYPNLVSIEANDDYTQYTVVTKNEEPDDMESASVLTFELFSDIYHTFTGTQADGVSVQFINEATGEVIEEINTGD